MDSNTEYMEQHAVDPTIEILQQLELLWGDKDLKKEIGGKLFLKVAKLINVN